MRYSMFRSASFVLLLVLTGEYVTPATAENCVQGQNCKLPNCFCPTFEHPLGAQNIPQIVYFGFDDAVQPQVSGYYKELFNGERKNPNGCPITMSLFVSNEYTLYELVNEFYSEGMEIGVHSVTHQDCNTAQKLKKEAQEQRQNIVTKGNVPESQVIGWRSPNLVTAGDDQPWVLGELNYTYDISLTYSTDNNYPWPFTLDYGYPYPCPISPCPSPTDSHKGFWEVIIHSLKDPETGIPCGYVDSCRPQGEDAALEYLWSNFLMVYETTRAPFGMNMHAAWFATPEYMSATARFIDQLLVTPNVYIVNVHQMLEWMKAPVPLSQIYKFTPWGCSKTQESSAETKRMTPQPAPTTIRADPQTTKRPAATSSPVEKVQENNERENNNEINSRQANSSPYLTWNRRPHRVNPWQWANVKTNEPVPEEEQTKAPVENSPRRSQLLQKLLTQTHSDTGDCDQGANCKLPDCKCRSRNPPMNLDPRGIPQIVYLAMDSQIDGQTFAPLLEIFSRSRKNPNGCPVSGTIFIPSSGNYAPYVDELKSRGVRVGVRGVTYSERLSGDALKERVLEEISGTQNQVSEKYGWRGFASLAPTDEIFQTLKNSGVYYDSSVITEASDDLWPYTLDFGLMDECAVNAAKCPTERYPGFWEVPIRPLHLGDDQNRSCAFPDTCTGILETEDEVYEVLKANFDRHYSGLKAPFGINLHRNWLTAGSRNEKLAGLLRFMDDILREENVVIVSVEQMLEWVKSPTETAQQFPC